MDYAKGMEVAGADAIELNPYYVPTDLLQPGSVVEQRYLNALKDVKSSVRIPVAVKLGPFFSSFAHAAYRFDVQGADGLVLFNRFYQPDVDLDSLDIVPNIELSTSADGRMTLRWIAILYDRIKADLAATSGIHTAKDVLKMLLVGADVTMMCSALFENGIGHVRRVVEDVKHWLEVNEYDSVEQMKGSLSQKSCADPAAFERANYMKALNSYHGY